MTEKRFNRDGSGSLKRKAKNLGYSLLFTAAMALSSGNVSGQTPQNMPELQEIPEYVVNNAVEFQKYKHFVRNMLSSENEETRKKGEFLNSDINKGFKYYLEIKKEKEQKKRNNGNENQGELPGLKKHVINSNGVSGTYTLGFVKDDDGYKYRYTNSLSMTGVSVDYKIAGYNANEMQKSRCRNAYCSNEVYKDIMKRTNNGETVDKAEETFIKFFEEEMKRLNLVRQEDGSLKNKDIPDNATVADELLNDGSAKSKGKKR